MRVLSQTRKRAATGRQYCHYKDGTLDSSYSEAMKIVWATDGSSGSEAALPYLKGLFNRGDNQIVITTIAPAPLLSDARPDPSMLLWNLIPGYRERVSKAVTDLVVGQVELLSKLRAEVTSAIRLGSAPSEILLLAREEQVDLIVTGAHGHTAAAEVLLGSVSRQVAANADCSVLIARGRARPQKLLLAYEGSPDADAAVDFLTNLRPAPGMEVTVLSVIEPIMPALGAPTNWVPATLEELHDWHRMNARKHSQRAARRLRAAGWAATARVSEGHPGNVILKTARDASTDLILIGARGVHSPGEEARGMGGIPRQILERAHGSVLIARAPRDDGQA